MRRNGPRGASRGDKALLVDELRKRWRETRRGQTLHASIGLKPEGLVLGADTLLASSTGRLKSRDGAAHADEARMLALLAVAYEQTIDQASLGHLNHALKRQGEGDDARALLHLALSGLRPLKQADAAAERLFLADGLLKAGVDPTRVSGALGLAIEGLEAALKRHNPTEPRLPVGETGAGEWTSDADLGAFKPKEVSSSNRPRSKPLKSRATPRATKRPDEPEPGNNQRLGVLSMLRETGYRAGQEGLAAAKVSSGIMRGGKPDPGGVSYGAYQLASSKRAGQRVQAFLASHWAAPWADEFGQEDPTLKDGAFGKIWKRVAQANPQGFFEAQHNYVKETNYDPMIRSVKSKTGLDINKQSFAIQNVAWSMAVQHGAASRLISEAINNLKSRPNSLSTNYQAALIDEIYKIRQQYVIKKGHPELIRRFVHEQNDAHAMLGS